MDEEEEIDENQSKEQFDKFIEALEKMPPLCLSRNDPCLCGSGKKYKKCRLEKDSAPSSFSELRLETFEIRWDEKVDELIAEIYETGS